MSDYDAIVVGAGHNGLTAAAILQRAGLKTVILEANTYAGGMAATVELIDGFRYEIAGSVQFPTPSDITKDLGLDTLPTVDADVQSVNIGEAGEEAMIFYRDPMELMTHLSEKHGTDAVMGMAELIAWSQGPAKALGRFDVRQPPKTIDEMYACAANEAERRAIHETLFGSAMDVIDRYLPNKEKHAVMRGMLAFLAINSTYRGPYTPGSATCLAFALAVPEEGGQMMTKLEGGIGALTEHLREMFESRGGEIRYRTKAEQILVDGAKVTGVRTNHGDTITAPVVVSNLSPDTTLAELVGADHALGSTARPAQGPRSPRLVHPDALRARRPPGVRAAVRVPQRARHAAIGRHLRLPRRTTTAMGERLPRHRPRQPVAGHADPVGARPGHGATRDARRQCVRLRLPRRNPARSTRPPQERDGRPGRREDQPLRPELQGHPDPAHHLRAVPHEHHVRRPAGDFCHGLLHPDLMGPNRPGPKGFRDLPIGIDGLYLGGAGCHGGPGITFIPGYNAAYQVLDDVAS